jgi:hypothetical protein
VFHPTLLRTTVLLVVTWATLSFGWYGLNIWIPTLLDKVKAPLNSYTVRVHVWRERECGW